MHEVLEQIGLAKNEAKVYLALIELGFSTAGTIAKKANIDRANTYDNLEKLKEKNLVSIMSQNSINYFEAADPEKLRMILSRKEQALNSVIETMKLKRNLSRENPVSIHNGFNNIRTQIELETKNSESLLVIDLDETNWFNQRLKELVNEYQFERTNDINISTYILDEIILIMDKTSKSLIRIKNKNIVNSYKKLFNNSSFQLSESSLGYLPFLSNQEQFLEPQILSQQE